MSEEPDVEVAERTGVVSEAQAPYGRHMSRGARHNHQHRVQPLAINYFRKYCCGLDPSRRDCKRSLKSLNCFYSVPFSVTIPRRSASSGVIKCGWIDVGVIVVVVVIVKILRIAHVQLVAFWRSDVEPHIQILQAVRSRLGPEKASG